MRTQKQALIVFILNPMPKSIKLNPNLNYNYTYMMTTK